MKQRKVIEKKLDTNNLSKIRNALGIIIAAFAFMIYAQSISFNYALDDTAVIKENKIVHQGISGIPELLKKSYWYGFTHVDDPIYRPLSMVLFAVEWQLFPDSPKVYHFMNVFLFALSGWLLFTLLCKLFGKQNTLVPFICSLLFITHPIHTEVVNNIKSSDEILCFLFAIVASLSFIKYLSNNSIGSLLMAIFSLFLCLLSKETGIVFLVLIPMMLYVFIKTEMKNIIKVSLMVVATVAVYVLMRFQILVATQTEGHLSVMDNSLMAAKDSGEYLATAFYVLLRYVGVLIIPHPLSYDYSFNQLPIQTFGSPLALMGVLIYVAMGAFAVYKIKDRNIFAFAILFYLISLFPVSNMYLKLASSMAERFMYIPSLGFCLVMTLLIIKITKTDTNKNKFAGVGDFFSQNGKVMMVVFVIAGLYSIKTISRNGDWRDNLTLFGHDVANADNSAKAHYNIGSQLIKIEYPAEKNAAAKTAMVDKAIVELQKAVAIQPNYPECFAYLATCFMNRNDYENSLKYEETYRNLHVMPDTTIHRNLGFLYQKMKQYDKALAEYDTVIRETPNFVSAYIAKGEIYGDKNMMDESTKMFEKAVEVNPNYITAIIDLGVNYGSSGRFAKAIEYFKRAEGLEPNRAEVLNLLATTYRLMGDSANAKIYNSRLGNR